MSKVKIKFVPFSSKHAAEFGANFPITKNESIYGIFDKTEK